jgi:hypothetical protein
VLAGFAMCCRELATRAELLQLKAIWIVTTIFLGDVVTLFAFDAGHSDLWADIRALACHGRAPFNSLKGPRGHEARCYER